MMTTTHAVQLSMHSCRRLVAIPDWIMTRRLRIPTELAVSLVGTSATLALALNGCNEGIPEPIDARRIPGVRHDSGTDARIRDALPADASERADAPPPADAASIHSDAHPPDAPPT